AVDEPDRVEIARHRSPRFLIGGVDQPHDEEEAHHGGHEIGKGDLPGAAVMAFLVIVAAAAHDDDLMPALVRGSVHQAITSRSAADHSAMRVSITVSSMAIERSRPSVSMNSARSARAPSADPTASRSDAGA